MRRVVTGGVLVLVCAGLAMAGGPPWMKWDQAKPAALGSGKPILVYSTVDDEGGSC